MCRCGLLEIQNDDRFLEIYRAAPKSAQTNLNRPITAQKKRWDAVFSFQQKIETPAFGHADMATTFSVRTAFALDVEPRRRTLVGAFDLADAFAVFVGGGF
jgi:hypothetical protein